MTSMSVWARSRTVLSMAALLALAACGGGGGGSASGGTPSTVSVSGVASKGLLAHAKVTAYAVKSDGSADESKVLGSAITNADGAYEITGLPASTPVILKVTPLAAEGTRPATTMKDEATGETVTVPVTSGFSLSAAVVLDASGSTSAQVTPFTDMAAKLAQTQAANAGAGVTIADVIKSANGAVSGALGVLLTDAPTFDTNGAPTNAAAVQLAAVSQMAEDNTGGELTAACPSLQLGTATTLEKVQCAVKALGDDVQTPTVAGAPLLSDALVANLNTAQNLVTVSPTVTVTAPDLTSGTTTVAVAGESKTAIEAAKALIASVRANATALTNQSDATSLTARLKAVADSSYGVAQPLDDGTLTAIGGVSDALVQRSALISNNAQVAGFQLPSVDWMWSQPFTTNLVTSGCKFYTDNTFTTEAYSGGVLATTDHMGCRILQQVVWAQEVGTGYWKPSYAVFHRVLLSKVSSTQFTVESVLKKANIVVSQGTYDPITNPYPYTTFNYDAFANETSLSSKSTATVTGSATGATLSGAFAPGVESTSTYNATTGFWDQGVRVLGTKQAVSVTLSDTAVDASTTRRGFSGSISVYDGATVQSQLSLQSGSYVQTKVVALASGTTTVVDGARLVIEGQVKSGFKIFGTLDLSNFTQTQNRWGPNNGSFAGYITDVGGTAKLFDGSLTLLMPTDTGLGWDAALNGTLVTTGANTMTVNLTAKQSATVDGDVTVTGRYTQGATTFLLTAMDSKTDLTKRQLALSETTGGVSFVAKASDTLVDIKKGTTVLGTFNVSTSRLVYADGTYEQF